MAICPECGAVVPSGTRFCTSCGTRVDLMEEKRPVTERAPRQAVNNKEKVVVQPPRAERQRRPISPFDERRPLPDEAYSPRGPALQTESPRVKRERPDQEPPPLFDDDEYFETKRPSRPIREEEEMRPRPKAPPQPRPNQPRPTSRQQIPVLGTGEYLISVLVMAIPIIGLVMGILWAKGAANPNKRNLANAMILLNIAGLVIGGVFALFKWVL